jgi:hypothetical protein
MIRLRRSHWTTEATMERSDIVVKKYVVRLSVEERRHLEDMTRVGKHAAGRLTELCGKVGDDGVRQAA